MLVDLLLRARFDGQAELFKLVMQDLKETARGRRDRPQVPADTEQAYIEHVMAALEEFQVKVLRSLREADTHRSHTGSPSQGADPASQG